MMEIWTVVKSSHSHDMLRYPVHSESRSLASCNRRDCVFPNA